MLILSNSDISYLRGEVTSFKSKICEYRDKLGTAISKFDDSNIAQSLYASGRFGSKEEAEIRKIKNALDKYCDVMENDLIVKTNDFLDNQERLNNEGR